MPGRSDGGEAVARQPNGTLAYIQGIEALEAADFKGAVTHLTRAIEADDDNADYHRARGVAHTLAEDFPAAIADLQRALKLRPGDREARLWLAAAYRMSGDPQTAAQYFTHGGEVPASYPSLVYNDMAMDYFSPRYRGVFYDRQANRTVEAHEPVKTLFAEVAAAYARRHTVAGAAATDVIRARMKARLGRGDYAAAVRDLLLLRRAAPDDSALRGEWALCLVGLGNALTAREELTRTLDVMPLWAEGYLGRAQAAAMLGDERRATADLGVASALGASSVSAVRGKVAKLLGPRVPDDAVARLARAVESEAPWPALVDAALAVQRWCNARRFHYDEAYQDRIQVLSMAIGDDPKDADYPELLARFLYNHHGVPAVWNGPRAGPELLRPQSRSEQQRELARGIQLADAALKLDPHHANALATKGWILDTLGQGGAAQEQADRGLAIEPQNVRLLRLKGQLLGDAAARLERQAALLRHGRTETHRERRSDGEYRVSRYFPPSAEQRAQAAALEARAAALRKQAEQLSREARRVETEVIPALRKEGDAALAAGNVPAARSKFEQAYAYQPDRDDLWTRLAEVAKRQGDALRQHVYALLAEPMRHTTAAGELTAAWDLAMRTAWKGAAAALDRAARTDPADARTPAYRSVIAMSRSDPTRAHRQRRTALALDEARARLMGTSFLSAGRSPIDPREAGLTLIVRLHEGNGLLAGGQNEQAVEAFAGNLTFEKRLGKEQMVELVPSAMLPIPTAEANRVPETPTFASLMAWSRLGLARAYLALGRPADAAREYGAVRASLSGWPSTAEGRETMYVVDSWARLGLAEAAFAAKDFEGAFRLLMSGEGWPWKLPEDLEKQRKALSDKVVAARQHQGEDALRQEEQMPLAQRRIRAVQQQIEQLEKQRQATQAELNGPGVSDREKQVLTHRVQQLDRVIGRMKDELAKPQQAPEQPEPAPGVPR